MWCCSVYNAGRWMGGEGVAWVAGGVGGLSGG